MNHRAAGASTAEDLTRKEPEAHVTSLKYTTDVSDQGTAVPGGVRRWRAFSLLAVAFFMTIMDV